MTFDLVGKAVKTLRLPTVDYNGSPIKIIPAQEGDVNSRFFNVTLFDDRGDIDLSCYTKVMLNATLPDGSLQTSDGDIDKKNNVAICKIAGSMLSQTGKVSCDVLFVGKDKNGEDVSLTSQTFYVFANRSQSGNNAISGNDNQTLFVQWLEQMEQLRDETKEAASERKEAASEAKEAASEAKEAASEAKEAASEAKEAAETFSPAVTLSGNDLDKAPSVRAVNDGLANKVNAQFFSGGRNRLYCARPNDPNSYRDIDSKPWMDCIPVYTNVENNIAPNTSKYGQATIVVVSPKYPYQSANKKYVDDTAAAIRAELGKHVFTVFQWSYGNQGWYVPHGALPIFYLETTLLEYSYIVDDVCAENFAKANFTKLTFLDENNNILDTKPATSQTFYEMPSGTVKIHHNGIELDYKGLFNPPWDSCIMRLPDLKFQIKVGA